MNKIDGPGRDRLLEEKILVPNAPVRLSRERLLGVLTESLGSYHATIVSGRAGSGKTALAIDFARHVRYPVSWYKVDAADLDLRVFYEYLVASVRLGRPFIEAERLIQFAAAASADDAVALAEAFVFQLSGQVNQTRPKPLLLIIEDLHLVFDAVWLAPFFHRLLPLLPVDLHLLITCRSMPPAPLWRLRSKQMLRVLGEAELNFTLEEAVELFETYGLAEELARVAWQRANGWAATINSFARTPGCAGRALAESLLEPARYGPRL